MVVQEVTVITALLAGLGSFLSPCVLPLAPVYLASLYGPGIYQSYTGRTRVLLFFHSLFFVLGFSVIFVALGAIAGLTGFAINPSSAALNKIAGILLIIFGLFIIVALKVPWLNYEKRLSPSLGHKTGYLRSFLIGAVFSLGWTPCVGPILGSILGVALNSATAWQGAYLLAVYSLGLGLPFLVIGVAFDRVTPLLRRVSRYTGIISILVGLLLITLGVLALMNKLIWFASLAG